MSETMVTPVVTWRFSTWGYGDGKFRRARALYPPTATPSHGSGKPGRLCLLFVDDGRVEMTSQVKPEWRQFAVPTSLTRLVMDAESDPIPPMVFLDLLQDSVPEIGTYMSENGW